MGLDAGIKALCRKTRGKERDALDKPQVDVLCSCLSFREEMFQCCSSKNERMIQLNEWVFSTIVIEKALISQNMSEKVANER